MILKAYSTALYASWYYYAPDRLLFDCGECAASILRQDIFAVESIFISHGHVDHIAGLLPFLCLRQSTKGDNDKPLNVYYPEGDRSLNTYRRALDAMIGHFVKYPLTWTGLNPGDTVPLRKGRHLHVLRADHNVDNPLSFVIAEERKRLRPELRGTPGPELARLSNEEKHEVTRANLFAYSGDSMPLAPDCYRGAEVLLHECTFLDEADRKYPVHSAIQEVLDLARDAEVQRVILTHISPRYFRRQIPGLLEKADHHGIPCDYVVPGRLNRF